LNHADQPSAVRPSLEAKICGRIKNVSSSLTKSAITRSLDSLESRAEPEPEEREERDAGEWYADAIDSGSWDDIDYFDYDDIDDFTDEEADSYDEGDAK